MLPQKYSRWILSVSFISLGTAFSAFYMDTYNIAWMPALVSLTSINYWRFPIIGWRRKLDMFAVGTSILYKIYLIPSCPFGFYVLLSIFVGAFFYFLGRYFHSFHYYLPATILHCMVHICGNIGLFLLIYSGK